MPPLANARGAPPLAARLGAWDLLAGVIAAASLGLHLRVVLLDRRAPADPGLYLKRVGDRTDLPMEWREKTALSEAEWTEIVAEREE